jgi:hypothetical protein
VPLLLLCAAAAGAEWTVGVYMCADNGMNDQSYRDIAEMAAVGSTPEVNIVVQVDRAARDSAPGCRRWLVRQGRLELLGDLGEVDMADPATLGAFGGFLGDQFPARNCLLVLWDHGTGWGEGYGPDGGRGQIADCRLQIADYRSENPGPRVPTDAIFIDESHRHMMGVAGGELAAALAAFQDGWGRRVSVLGFDACFMGMVEVACEAIGRADLMLAAEGLVPVQGWPYAEMLGRLTARPTTPPAEFATAACADYVAGYPEDTVELAAVDLAKLDRLMPALAEAVAARGGDALLRAARGRVQTFSANGARPPCADDEQVDLAHLWDLAGGPESLRTRLAGAVVARANSGGHLANARGLACWFPARYLSLKSLYRSYAKLSFAGRVGWAAMLNRWFGADDIKPHQPELTRHRFGRRGDLRLWWSSTADLAPVSYDLYQSQAAAEVLSDDCEDLDGWIAVGWTVSSARFRSGARSFFSGTGANLDRVLESVRAIALPEGGLLSLYTWYQTLETEDSNGFRRDVIRVEWASRRGNWRALDSLYGSDTEWRERRYVLPASDSVYLRVRFTTGGAVGGAGCYIDDIKVYTLPGLDRVAAGLEDTSFTLTGLARNPGGYGYFVTAVDSFGNVSSASEFYDVAVDEYAEPYTMPAPFAGACRLVLDFPAGAECRVSIYTLSGALVCRFDRVARRELAWDGRNEYGRELASGVYLVLVEADGFRKLGRVARAGD